MPYYLSTDSINPTNTKVSIGIIILLCMLFVTMFMIYKMYQTKLTSKTFLINIYLYILVGLLFVSFMGMFTKNMEIVEYEHTFKFIIVYFIAVCSGIFLMISDKLFINHIGFLLMLLGLSLIIGSSFKYSKNILQATTITSIIMIVLTIIAFKSPENNLMKMANWLPILLCILVGLIIVELGYIFFVGTNRTFSRVLVLAIVGLFSFFILSHTSNILLKSKKLTCKTHSCVNYPMESSGLLLDFLNIFTALSGNH